MSERSETLWHLAESFNTVITAVDLAMQHEIGIPADDAMIRRQAMAHQLVTAWCAVMADYSNPRVAVQAPSVQPVLPLATADLATHANLPAAAQVANAGGTPQEVMAAAMTPPAPRGPLADTLEKIAAGLHRERAAGAATDVQPPTPTVPAGQGAFDEWVALADALGYNVADLMRQWFRDVQGGWDRATPEEQAAQYNKALAYYQNKAAREPGEIDPAVCYRCGTRAEEHKTRNGEPFFKCPNPRCGFNGQRGWVPTMWDITNRSEKAAKWEAAKASGQQRRGGYAKR